MHHSKAGRRAYDAKSFDGDLTEANSKAPASALHPMRSYKTARRIARIVLILVIGLAVSEVALRITAALLSRNAWADFSIPSGKTIYAIGDSFTYGTGIERNQAYPAVLGGLLREAGLRDVQVINNGWPGLSSANALYAVAKVIDEADPALLLVMTGWNANDTDFARHRDLEQGSSWANRLDNALESSRVYGVAKQALTYRKRTAHFGTIELVPQAPAMELYDFGAYQEIARKHLRQIIGLCRAREVPLVLLNYPYQRLPNNQWELEYEYYHLVFGRSALAPSDYLVDDKGPTESGLHAVIRTLATETSVPMIDLNAVFVESGREDLFQSDWHHPTEQGHRLIAQAIADRIAPVLEASPDARQP